MWVGEFRSHQFTIHRFTKLDHASNIPDRVSPAALGTETMNAHVASASGRTVTTTAPTRNHADESVVTGVISSRFAISKATASDVSPHLSTANAKSPKYNAVTVAASTGLSS